MRIKLLKLNKFSYKVSNEIRTCLDKNNIEYFETSRVPFDNSQSTIWLKDKKQEKQARELIREFKRKASTNGKITILDKYREDKKSFISLVFILAIVIFLIAIGAER